MDENVAPPVTGFLRGQGDDVLDVKEQGWFGRSDAELLAIAQQDGRVILTYDVDFASIRRLGQEHPGITFVRLRNLEPDRVIQALEQFLTKYGEKDLGDTLAVLDEFRVRFRKTR